MRGIWIALIVLGLATIACDISGAPPTIAVVTATVPPATITPRGLPPSWTPGLAPTDTPKSEFTSTALPTNAVANTLPASWTPAVIPTSTPFAIATQKALPPTAPRATLTPAVTSTRSGPRQPPTPAASMTYSSVCSSFQLDTQKTTIRMRVNTVGTIAWTSVEGAEGYEVWVIFLDGRYIVDQKTAETSINIPQEIFRVPGGYGWEVMPLKNGDRLCPSLTGVIVAIG